MSPSRKIFIGGAWPYANGSLHIGQVAALLPGDIIARYHRLRGDDVLYVSGSDCHGTPIAVRAVDEGTPPRVVAERYHEEISRTFADLGFSYDLYTSTLTSHHLQYVQEIVNRLWERGHLEEREQDLPYCAACSQFLPDRYVLGTCPSCGATDARGDECPQCSQVLDVSELAEPRCARCSEVPDWRRTRHLFLKLDAFAAALGEWVANTSQRWRKNAASVTQAALDTGLRARPITREIDWGVPVGVRGYESKCVYVWFEAVCGYLTASRAWAEASGDLAAWEPYWGESAFHYYVHGKDNIFFHTVLWPATLMGLGDLHLPDHIVSSGHVTLERKWLSTSRNWAIWAPDFLERYDADALRYFLVANGPENSDADFSWREFRYRNNAELLGCYGNFIHRVLTQVVKNWDARVPPVTDATDEDRAVTDSIPSVFENVGRCIEQGALKSALQAVISLADTANKYIDSEAPWDKAKSHGRRGTILRTCVDVIGALVVLAHPFLPQSTQRAREMLGLPVEPSAWVPERFRDGHSLRKPSPLYRRLDESIVDEELARIAQDAD